MTSVTSCESENYPVSQSYLYDHMEKIHVTRKNGRNAFTSYVTKKSRTKVGAPWIKGAGIHEKRNNITHQVR